MKLTATKYLVFWLIALFAVGVSGDKSAYKTVDDCCPEPKADTANRVEQRIDAKIFIIEQKLKEKKKGQSF